MASDASSEPTMEEILASIRRIISEDDPAATPPPGEEVLELSGGLEPGAALDQNAIDSMDFGGPFGADTMPDEAAADDLDIFDRVEAAAADFGAKASAEAKADAAPAFAASAGNVARPSFGRPDDALIGESAYAAAIDAFARLASAMTIASVPGQTVEGLVRELLRPMMQEWLDRNLPGIVNEMVAKEIQRVARGGMQSGF